MRRSYLALKALQILSTAGACTLFLYKAIEEWKETGDLDPVSSGWGAFLISLSGEALVRTFEFLGRYHPNRERNIGWWSAFLNLTGTIVPPTASALFSTSIPLQDPFIIAGMTTGGIATATAAFSACCAPSNFPWDMGASEEEEPTETGSLLAGVRPRPAAGRSIYHTTSSDDQYRHATDETQEEQERGMRVALSPRHASGEPRGDEPPAAAPQHPSAPTADAPAAARSPAAAV